MLKSPVSRFLLLVILGGIVLAPLMFISCDGKIIEIIEAEPPEKEPSDDDDNDEDSTSTPSPNNNFILVGKGDGSALVIDGSTRVYDCDSTIKIKGGPYASITIRNLRGRAGCPIKIVNNGTVALSGNGSQLRISDLRHVVIHGDGTRDIPYGFTFKNMDTDAVQLNGAINDFIFSHASFNNVNGYGVIRYKPAFVYDGSDESFVKNLKFLNISCEGCGTLIRFEGSEGNNSVIGLIRSIEIAHVHFKNAPNVGSVVVLEKAENYDIHNNIVENVNTQNSNHNGIFYMQGNGKFYNNLIRDHQGNAIRAWIYSIGNTPKDVLVFNNIVVNSREYGAFELQSFDRDIVSGKSTYANAQVFNNTCGNLRPKGGTFPAQIVDLYSLRGGDCQIFNNVGYSFYRVGQHNTNYFWNQLGDTKPTKGSNNQYYDTYQQAGIVDDVQFLLHSNSPLKKAAEFFHLLKEDFYGNMRGSTPSVGAVE